MFKSENKKESIEKIDSSVSETLFTNHRYVCKEFLSCDTIKCLNGGQCVKLDNINRGSHKLLSSTYKCSCPAHTTGSYCEQIIDACYSMPCLNNGSCQSKPYEKEITCKCDPLFNGKFCENKMVLCETNPCMNGAKCIIPNIHDSKNFECLCTKEYKNIYIYIYLQKFCFRIK